MLVRCSSVTAGHDAINDKMIKMKKKENVERMHELHTTYVRNSSPSRNSRRHVYFLSLSLSVSLPIFSTLYIYYILYSYTIYVLSILFTFSSPFFLCNFVCLAQSTVVKCSISREAHVNVKNGLTKPKGNRYIYI